MSLLDQWRAEQHEDLAMTSDHQLAAFMALCDPQVVARERAAHASVQEWTMLHHLCELAEGSPDDGTVRPRWHKWREEADALIEVSMSPVNGVVLTREEAALAMQWARECRAFSGTTGLNAERALAARLEAAS